MCTEAVRVLEEIDTQIQRYLLSTLGANLLVGAVTWLVSGYLVVMALAQPVRRAIARRRVGSARTFQVETAATPYRHGSQSQAVRAGDRP